MFIVFAYSLKSSSSKVLVSRLCRLVFIFSSSHGQRAIVTCDSPEFCGLNCYLPGVLW
jgi:hypothetical protein